MCDLFVQVSSIWKKSDIEMIVCGYNYVIKRMHQIVQLHSSLAKQKQEFARLRKSCGGDLNTLLRRYKTCILSAW
jgi:hypothetical protein